MPTTKRCSSAIPKRAAAIRWPASGARWRSDRRRARTPGSRSRRSATTSIPATSSPTPCANGYASSSTPTPRPGADADVRVLRLQARPAARRRPGLRRALPAQPALRSRPAPADRHAMQPVVAFLEGEPEVLRMRDDIARFVANWLPSYIRDNRNYLTVAIGCTGGQHRSVYFAEWLGREFAEQGARAGPAPRTRTAAAGNPDALAGPARAPATGWSSRCSALAFGVTLSAALARRHGRAAPSSSADGEVFAELDLSRNRHDRGPRAARHHARSPSSQAAPASSSDPGPRQYCVRQGWLERARRNRHLRAQSGQRADRRADQGL